MCRPGVPPSGGGGLCSASHIFRQGSHGATQRRGSGGGRGAGTPGGGEAVGACPVEAIHPAAPRATDGEKCIRCLACVRACPAGSRRVEGPAFAATAAHLEEALTKGDKPPELYL
ncbi:4Fe-4S binding protein [Flavonifractor plautii]|uniref:4Fe-4S ferredoxin-type domain-containing protein n=1 Tax=Flavonifractor plautii TaxID=292800 RepID=A0A6I2R2D6_FLAPL|nr:hypothetical protein [Flavonifractor plautii]MSB83855.1 hypothetical protein [Flavonifractor plautii]